jgi:hypothetical protein
VATAPGPVGAGNVGVLIRVTDPGHGVCTLSGYPTVRLLGATGAAQTVAREPLGYLGGPAAGTPVPNVPLGPGVVATALVEGTDFPIGGATSCPAFPGFTVSLPGRSAVVTFHRRLGICEVGAVHPFVIGFDGTTPTGEVVGTGPSCPTPAPAGSFGPVVPVDAWSGTRLAGSVDVFGGPHTHPPYHLVLAPGPYAIRSGGADKRRVTVVAGRTVRLGTFGRCAHQVTGPGSTPTTVHP